MLQSYFPLYLRSQPNIKRHSVWWASSLYTISLDQTSKSKVYQQTTIGDLDMRWSFASPKSCCMTVSSWMQTIQCSSYDDRRSRLKEWRANLSAVSLIIKFRQGLHGILALHSSGPVYLPCSRFFPKQCEWGTSHLLLTYSVEGVANKNLKIATS